MKVIFLDFDGVLNCERHFKEMEEADFKEELEFLLRDLDVKKIALVKKICDETGAKIVVSSSWRKMKNYLQIQNALIEMGLPIIGTTGVSMRGSRGTEIREYLCEHSDIDDYIVLDDVSFIDFDDEIKNHFIQTSFYEDGLEEAHAQEAIYKLGLKQN